ncbi:MAG TPA: hypothetical protein VJZ26_06340 [Blastocatellia bacterium]|nr:hypothetical protein [Blastocatellia bacterium]
MSSRVQERVSRFEVRKVRGAQLPFGLRAGEIVAASLALLFFIVVVVYYFTSLVPEQSRLSSLESELAKLKGEISVGKTPEANGPATAASVRDALDSLQTFKTEYLRPLTSGRIDLINQINALAKKDGVALMSGIDMPLQKAVQADEEAANKRKKAEDLFNVYPHMDMHFTVFGQYENLRSFLNDLERVKQFMVIRSIGILSQEEKTGGGGGGRHGSRGEGVSGLALTIDASAYFQP